MQGRTVGAREKKSEAKQQHRSVAAPEAKGIQVLAASIRVPARHLPWVDRARDEEPTEVVPSAKRPHSAVNSAHESHGGANLDRLPCKHV